MYKQNGTPNFYIVTGYIDFRCGINSLCQKVKLIDPTFELTSNIAIVFMSRTKDKLKILYWGGDGFWLLSHQLEESKYKRMKDENNLKSITVKQLEWLLDGLEMNPKNYHKEVEKEVLFYQIKII